MAYNNEFPTGQSLALVMQELVVAEFVSIDANTRLGDGYRSTARFRVVEPLKGDLRAGEDVLVRMTSGYDAADKLQLANDEPSLLPNLPGALKLGSRWLLPLSEQYRDWLALLLGKKPVAIGSARVFATFGNIREVQGNRLLGSCSDMSDGDLAALRQAAAPVDMAWDAATKAEGRPLMRRRIP